MEDKKKKELILAVKFGLFSASAGLIQAGVFLLLNFYLGEEKAWFSHLIALVCSVIWNFTINRKFTFKSAANVPVAMMKILAYYLVFTPLSTWWMKELVGIGWNEVILEGLTMVINFVTEFCVYRFWVYRNSIDSLEKKTK